MLASLRSGLFIFRSPDFAVHSRTRNHYSPSTFQPHLATIKMFFNNNFTGTTAGYPVPDNNSFGLNGYPFEATNYGPPTYDGSDLEGGIDGLSAAEIEDWWLAPNPDGNAGQYSGSTFLESFRNEHASPHESQTGQTPESSESYCSVSSAMDRMFSANSSLRL
jgi:hypothetical protein